MFYIIHIQTNEFAMFSQTGEFKGWTNDRSKAFRGSSFASTAWVRDWAGKGLPVLRDETLIEHI